MVCHPYIAWLLMATTVFVCIARCGKCFIDVLRALITKEQQFLNGALHFLQHRRIRWKTMRETERSLMWAEEGLSSSSYRPAPIFCVRWCACCWQWGKKVYRMQYHTPFFNVDNHYLYNFRVYPCKIYWGWGTKKMYFSGYSLLLLSQYALVLPFICILGCETKTYFVIKDN